MEDFSIADLVDLVDVRPKTVETFIGDLKSRGLIESGTQPASGKGRPRSSHRLTPEGRRALLNDLRRERERKMKVDEESPTIVQNLLDGSMAPNRYPVMIQTVRRGPSYLVFVA